MEVPTLGDPKYRKWKKENAIVVGWLLNSVKPKISGLYILLEIVQEIWDALSQAYFEIGNMTEVYELHMSIAQFKLGDLSLCIYYSSFWKMWETLEHHTTFRPSCARYTVA